MSSPDPFAPVTLGSFDLANHFVMAPMTRARSPERIPVDAVVDYYRQRAGTGLIITEATQISPQGTGSIATPGIHTQEQITGWRRVTDAVHAAAGRIICQIWHVGRVSHSKMQAAGEAPVSSSATAGEINTFTADGFEPCTPPRALALEEIPGVIAQYRQGALNAIEAGFDGVQIHAASGYLIDQFLRDGVNQREDGYGGSVENRARFLLEVTDAVSAAIGADRTSVRLSPFTVTWDCSDSDPRTVFTHAVRELDKRPLAFLEIVERGFDSLAVDTRDGGELDFTPGDLRKLYRGNLVANGCYDLASARDALESGHAQAISIGRPLMSTPDWVHRQARQLPLNKEIEPIFWYGGSEEGYSDQAAAQQE